jgi:transposase-like protein/transposase Tn5 family protein
MAETWMSEVAGEIELGDERLRKRFLTLAETFLEKPASSIPEACGTGAATPAAYRFFDNEAVVPDELTDAMAEATARRCQGLSRVLAVPDPTSLDFTGHTDTVGWGPLEHPRHRGLFVHTTLAVDPRGGVPLGIMSQLVWARDPPSVGKGHQRKEVPVEAKESARWLISLLETEAHLGASVRVLSVADREADVSELFVLAHEVKGDWLIRARHDRNLGGGAGHVIATVEQPKVSATSTVTLPRTNDRVARRATRALRRAPVVLVPPERRQGQMAAWWAAPGAATHLVPPVMAPLRVGVVLVTEVAPPLGVKPVRWLLLTNRPMETTEQALECVEDDRLRWLIERFHYVLKSGCQVEKRQLETAARLRRALVVYSEVAWRLLWLTSEARTEPDATCSTVFTDLTWQLLWMAVRPKIPLPVAPPTWRTATRQTAQLGGFLARNGDGEPGGKTLWRGLRRLQDMEAGAVLFQQHPDFLPTLRAG